ncbi:MSMEG_0565 family glycosyltransferase [Rhizobium mesosinicum]|uniref:MSMEG_0565 family glycosyltransferase n=1 Tax=Rhizobium mesosinicum TaxID=335017 RepID=A0ABS7GWQ5_9HYPH|nr:MSMEG_0565 family glycosyltransferase [Rhizobium mesosinicum]MBW9053619.1 MSMEG_0565 family glycosyltransferase [Rhizobium mesosinicum]
MSRPLRIAMLAHSTNPRGGVVHAMQLSEALAALGHQVVLHAPDAKGTGFFREPVCGAVLVPVAQVSPPSPQRGEDVRRTDEGAERSDASSGKRDAELAGAAPSSDPSGHQPGSSHGSQPVLRTPAGEKGEMTVMVEQRIADYVRYFENPAARDFDIYHAHDGISGNALATLKERGLIPAFVRTVHHIDQFADIRLMELQDRSIDRADLFFTVSSMWCKTLKETRGISSSIVGNGVDTKRFSPAIDVSALRRKLALPDGPVFLAVGGIEARKNTIAMLEAFRQVRAIRPDAQFVIAGGASLLDHRGYQGEFRAVLSSLGEHAAAVHILGTVADEDMPALLRLADTLVFASVKEGFGLVVLEAMASGVPVVVSSIAPFTEYLCNDDVVWCDPQNSASIAEAMAISLMPPVRAGLIPRGLDLAAHHSWQRTAAAHLQAYETLKEPAHA